MIKVAVNPHLVNKPPSELPYKLHKSIWRAINGRFVNKKLTLGEFIQSIINGHPYAPWHYQYRHKDRFLAGQVVSLDFDNGNGKSKLSSLLQDEFILEYGSFLYTTPSHTEEHPKARAVFILDTEIKNAEYFAKITRGIFYKYDFADEQCKDPCRIFFGSKDAEVVIINRILPIEIAVSTIVTPFEEYQKEKEKKREEAASNITNTNHSGLENFLKAQLMKIQTAPLGSKNNTRIRISRLVGGLVAAGYIAEAEAESMLIDAALSNTSRPDLATHDVQAGLQYGLSSPVYLEKDQMSFSDWGIKL